MKIWKVTSAPKTPTKLWMVEANTNLKDETTQLMSNVGFGEGHSRTAGELIKIWIQTLSGTGCTVG